VTKVTRIESRNHPQLKELMASPPENTIAAHPLTGFRPTDMAQILGDVLLQGVQQPLTLSKHLSSHARKLVDVLASKSKLAPNPRDPRFKDAAWQDHTGYRRLMQSYLAMNESLREWIADLDLNEVDRLRADFLYRVVSESLSPTNTLLGNPEALRKARDTRGKSLLKGAANLLSDLRKNHGIPSQVQGENFVVGENLATSSGAVVFKNEILELIQYTPSTKEVYRRPLLLVSAMINKFYALDLTPDRSFIKYCVDSGQQVFIVSWANPTSENSDWGIEQYALAVMEAITAIKSITRCQTINLYALCSGAMMCSAMAACMKARGDRSIHSMSIGVCMLEMASTDAEYASFTTPKMIQRIQKRSAKAGILRGHELAISMLLLRPQDLIWGNVVNNYLLGNSPPEFDLLYWNNDWTSLPARLHLDLLEIFSDAALSKPGAFKIDSTPIDLSALDCDKFFFGGLSDHITPWQACYRSMMDFGDNKEFLLSNSGHMQTMLNAPGKRHASYFTNAELPEFADAWLESATYREGSWWPEWSAWITPRSLSRKAAPKKLGNNTYPPGAAAPGDYVHQQSV
jgi:polyhydroxyalkanoate synthase